MKIDFIMRMGKRMPDKCDRCSGCAFENYIYNCVKSGCLGCEREDGESVRYTIVNT